ncbi:MAG: hypothetical protein AB7R55_06655 [Gemmatimonadales bacterium]
MAPSRKLLALGFPLDYGVPMSGAVVIEDLIGLVRGAGKATRGC